MFKEQKFPANYKKVDGFAWNKCRGRMAGSAQPGMFASALHDDLKIIKLESGLSLQEAKVDAQVLNELEGLYNDGIRTIYCVCNIAIRRTELVKYLWENLYPDTQYLTQVNGISIQVEDFKGFSTDQLRAIALDAQERISRGESILVHCRGGVGRTGTALAAIFMQMFNETNLDTVINYIRANYNEDSVESSPQIDSLSRFALIIEGEKSKIIRQEETANVYHDWLKEFKYLEPNTNTGKER